MSYKNHADQAWVKNVWRATGRSGEPSSKSDMKKIDAFLRDKGYSWGYKREGSIPSVRYPTQKARNQGATEAPPFSEDIVKSWAKEAGSKYEAPTPTPAGGSYMNRKAASVIEQIDSEGITDKNQRLNRIAQIIFGDKHYSDHFVNHYSTRLAKGNNKDEADVAHEVFRSHQYRTSKKGQADYLDDIAAIYKENGLAPPTDKELKHYQDKLRGTEKENKEFSYSTFNLDNLFTEAQTKRTPYENHKRKLAEREAAKDYWKGLDTMVGGKGRDLSPHGDSSLTFEGERMTHWYKDGDDHRDSPAAIQEIESKFVDELYGTDGDPETDGAIAEGKATELWGLDLRRVWPDEDKMNFGTEEYYEHVTRGEVDWGHYKGDSKYKSAFTELGYDISKLGDDSVASVRQIRSANEKIGLKALQTQDPDSWKMHWEGKYDADKILTDKEGNLWEDDKKQKTLSDLYSVDPDDLSKEERAKVQFEGLAKTGDHFEGGFTPIKKPSREISATPKLPGIRWGKDKAGNAVPTLTNPTKVTRPKNIPKDWGPV